MGADYRAPIFLNRCVPVKNVFEQIAPMTPYIIYIRETISRPPRNFTQVRQELLVIKILHAAVFNKAWFRTWNFVFAHDKHQAVVAQTKVLFSLHN